MYRAALLLALLLSMCACTIGPSVHNLAPSHSGQGLEGTLWSLGRGHAPRLEKVAVELLAVEPTGLLLRRLDSAENPLLRISYPQIQSVKFHKMARLTLRWQRPPTAAQQAELQRLSRYPQGVDEALLARLLAAYHQPELHTIR